MLGKSSNRSILECDRKAKETTPESRVDLSNKKETKTETSELFSSYPCSSAVALELAELVGHGTMIDWSTCSLCNFTLTATSLFSLEYSAAWI